MKRILDEDQRAAAEHTARILRIDAGPGAGKTEVLAQRIVYLLVSGLYQPGQIVALTFTRSMAADLRRRITAALPPDLPCRACDGRGKFLPEHDGATGFDCGACYGTGRMSVEGVTIGTLHALAAKWVRLSLKGDLAGGTAVKALGLVLDHTFGLAVPEDVDDMLVMAQETIGKKKITQKALKEGLTLVGRELDNWPPHTEARRQLRARNLATYDDLLVMLRAAVIAPAAGPGEKTLRQMHPCLLVDEMQDLSALHWHIIRAWGPNALTYVGDDAQAIYGFLAVKAGLDEAAEAARAAFDEVAVRVQLGRNYRSRPFLVDATDLVRRQLAQRGACSALPLSPARPGAPGSVDLFDHTQGAELPHTDRVVEAVQRALCVAERPEDVVVLAPLNAELDEVASALEAAGIPAQKIERAKGAWKTAPGRALVAMARAADLGFWTRFDATLVLRACARETEALDAAELAAMEAGRPLALALDDTQGARILRMNGTSAGWWQAVANAQGLEDLVSLATDLRNLAGLGALTASDALAAWIADFRGAGAPAARDFLVWLASSETATATVLREGCVCLSTLHGAKGLEWPEVVLAGTSQGSLPPVMVRPGDVAGENEWHRALYVGMTRASEGLALVCPQMLRGKFRHPTRVLIDAGIAQPNPNAE